MSFQSSKIYCKKNLKNTYDAILLTKVLPNIGGYIDTSQKTIHDKIYCIQRH